MKIWLVLLSSFLVIASGLSGFYIYSLNTSIYKLNTHIGDLESQVENQFTNTDNRLTGLDSKIIDTKSTLTDMLQASESEYTVALQDQETSFNDYRTATESTISGIQGDITSAYSQIGTITTDVSQIRDNVLFSEQLYDKVKSTVVTITSDETEGSGLIYDQRLLGSGFLYNGRVITAYHVVEDVQNIRITVADGTILAGYIEMYSKELDVAVLFISFVTVDNYDEFLRYIDNLSDVDIADSDTVKPGDPVFVIGSPGDGEEYRMGLKGTLTSGMVSQVNRCTTVENEFRTNLIQFDAPVNFGNSGSPLFNKDGEVIGLVIARLNPLIGDGISLAVTSNQVLNLENAIPPGGPDETRANGPLFEDKCYPWVWNFKPSTHEPLFKYEDYPWSGLTVKDFETYNPFDRQFVTIAGAEVTNSIGPAVGAGIQKGDIITALDDITVHNSDEFFCFLADHYKVGDTVSVTIMRGKYEQTTIITLEQRP